MEPGLKTLKDFEDGECEDCNTEHGYGKDKEYSKLISEKDLRREAIRIVKYLDETDRAWCFDCNESPTEKEGNIERIREKCRNHRTVWMDGEELQLFKHFFNIEEEDLK